MILAVLTTFREYETVSGDWLLLLVRCVPGVALCFWGRRSGGPSSGEDKEALGRGFPTTAVGFLESPAKFRSKRKQWQTG